MKRQAGWRPAWSWRAWRIAWIASLLSMGLLRVSCAEPLPEAVATPLTPATITAQRHADEMPYTHFMQAMAAFQAGLAHAPNATLRFVVVPRESTEALGELHLRLVDPDPNDHWPAQDLPLASDGSFTLPLIDGPIAQHLVVRSNLPEGSLHWRPLVISAAMSGAVRRLGDLRLECEVKEAGELNRPDLPWWARMFDAANPSACRSGAEHVFLAPFALRSALLIDADRVLELDPERVAESSANRLLPRAYTVYEPALRVRAYAPPLEDASWPDDARVELVPAAAP